MAPFIPAQAVAPTNIGQARQPARPASLGIAGGDAGAVERFIGPMQGGQQLDEGQQEGPQRVVLLPDVAVELLPRGHLRKSGP